MARNMESIRAVPSSFLGLTCRTRSAPTASRADFFTDSRIEAFFWLHKICICFFMKTIIVSGNSNPSSHKFRAVDFRYRRSSEGGGHAIAIASEDPHRSVLCSSQCE
ncbi:hypothetical protein V8G54_034315 [Vigna mungo]|uniref:Uncharacterized protein n=1 Tax=Vigna mungo TaxID=3915 RepID=A0AAQ3MQ84_VIGMU